MKLADLHPEGTREMIGSVMFTVPVSPSTSSWAPGQASNTGSAVQRAKVRVTLPKIPVPDFLASCALAYRIPRAKPQTPSSPHPDEIPLA